MEAASDEWEPNGWSPTLSSNGHAPSTSTAVRTNQSDTHASNHVFNVFANDDFDDSSDVPSLAPAVDGENENLWLCRACDSADWRVSPGHGWTCMRCGNDTFYDALPPRPSPHMLAVGSLFQMPHLAMLAAVETMMIQMMPRCRKPMLSPRQ